MSKNNELTTERRKIEHIEICLTNKVESYTSTWFEYVRFVHNPLPEINIDEIDVSTSFLGRKISLPLMISGMTGGSQISKKINKMLAEVAEQKQIPIGVGSQRAGIENPKLIETYRIVRDVAPTTIVIGNIGAPQISSEYDISKIIKAIEMIDADALAIHLNALQEAIQPEGNAKYKGVIEKIGKIQSELDIPIIVKETGAGLTRNAVKILKENYGIKIFDVSGLGGTSFSAVEVHRAIRIKDEHKEKLGKLFWDWGVPTAAALVDLYTFSDEITIIASGGIRTGIDICKSLSLGAHIAGMALPFLKVIHGSGVEGAMKFIDFIEDQIKICMFLIGASSVEKIRKASIFIYGPLAEWVKCRYGFSEGTKLLSYFMNRSLDA